MADVKQKGGYRSALSCESLSRKVVYEILALVSRQLKLHPVPPDILKGQELESAIDRSLAQLPLYVALGHKSWNGLVVCFPGRADDLSMVHVSTPYLRKILYPILDLNKRLQQQYSGQLRCIYLVGDRFTDVFLRKFRLLESLTPHVIILTGDLLKAKLTPDIPERISSFNEAWVQAYLSREMQSKGGLEIPLWSGETIRAGFLANEFPTSEGTKNPERLDILAYDASDKSLIAFELKGPGCSRSEFENLFLQGAEHRNWLEANKMAVKFFLEGYRARKINTRKRVRLILGFFQDNAPLLFQLLRHEAIQKDRHLQIDFVQIKGTRESGLTLSHLNPESDVSSYLAEMERRGKCCEGFYIDEYGRKSDVGFYEEFFGLD